MSAHCSSGQPGSMFSVSILLFLSFYDQKHISKMKKMTVNCSAFWWEKCRI